MANLSPEEQEILAELHEEEVETRATSDQYHEDDTVQRNIMGALLSDRHFCVQAQGLVKPHYFVNEAHQLLCRILFDYFDNYRQVPPRQYVVQEMEDEISNRKPEIKQYFRTELVVVYEYYVPGAEARDYLLDRITNFAKTQSLKNAFNRCLEELKRKQGQETWLKIYDILRSALTIDRNFDPGLEYFQSFEERYARMMREQEEGEIFTSSFAAIDDALVGGGLSRGEVGSWMGLPGTGKSLALVAAAIANVHLGKKVLYLSLEMDEDKVAARFDAQFANMTKKHENLTINNLIENKEIVFEALRDYVKEYEDPRLLIVKQFPAGNMDVAMFRAYLTQMKLRGFAPDLVILDYIGEMKDYPDMPTWESRNKITRDLRGLAVEEKICILTAMQPRREAREKSNELKDLGIIDDSNLADAYGQSRPLDAMWSINQFQDEKDCGLARIFVVKHRHGKSRFTFHVEFDNKTLRMSQISQAVYEKRLKEHRATKEVITKQNAEKDLMNQKINQIVGDAGEKLKQLKDEE